MVQFFWLGLGFGVTKIQYTLFYNWAWIIFQVSSDRDRNWTGQILVITQKRQFEKLIKSILNSFFDYLL